MSLKRAGKRKSRRTAETDQAARTQLHKVEVALHKGSYAQQYHLGPLFEGDGLQKIERIERIERVHLAAGQRYSRHGITSS